MFNSKTDHLNWSYVSHRLLCDDFSTNTIIPRNEFVIGPRESGLPCPTVALDRPGVTCEICSEN